MDVSYTRGAAAPTGGGGKEVTTTLVAMVFGVTVGRTAVSVGRTAVTVTIAVGIITGETVGEAISTSNDGVAVSVGCGGEVTEGAWAGDTIGTAVGRVVVTGKAGDTLASGTCVSTLRGVFVMGNGDGVEVANTVTTAYVTGASAASTNEGEALSLVVEQADSNTIKEIAHKPHSLLKFVIVAMCHHCKGHNVPETFAR